MRGREEEPGTERKEIIQRKIGRCASKDDMDVWAYPIQERINGVPTLNKEKLSTRRVYVQRALLGGL